MRIGKVIKRDTQLIILSVVVVIMDKSNFWFKYNKRLFLRYSVNILMVNTNKNITVMINRFNLFVVNTLSIIILK